MPDTSPAETITPDEFYNRCKAWISSVYDEMDKYETKLPDDPTALGIKYLSTKQITFRGWAERTLKLHQDSKRYLSASRAMAAGKEALYEQHVKTYMRDTQWPKISSEERRSNSELQYVSEQLEYQKFEDLTDEFRALVESAEKKYKDILDAKNDLRAQLWAIRLSLVLGEYPGSIPSANNAKELAARAVRPVFEEGKHDDLKDTSTDTQLIDELLKETQKERGHS